jgi:hypothetical protein
MTTFVLFSTVLLYSAVLLNAEWIALCSEGHVFAWFEHGNEPLDFVKCGEFFD